MRRKSLLDAVQQPRRIVKGRPAARGHIHFIHSNPVLLCSRANIGLSWNPPAATLLQPHSNFDPERHPHSSYEDHLDFSCPEISRRSCPPLQTVTTSDGSLLRLHPAPGQLDCARTLASASSLSLVKAPGRQPFECGTSRQHPHQLSSTPQS